MPDYCQVLAEPLLWATRLHSPIHPLYPSTLHESLQTHPQLFSTAHSTAAETCSSCPNSQWIKALASLSQSSTHTPFPAPTRPPLNLQHIVSPTFFSALARGILAPKGHFRPREIVCAEVIRQLQQPHFRKDFLQSTPHIHFGKLSCSMVTPCIYL